MHLSGVSQKNSENFLDEYMDTSKSFLPNIDDNFILYILCIGNMIVVINNTGNIVFKKSIADDKCIYNDWINNITDTGYNHLSNKKHAQIPDLSRIYFEEYFDTYISPSRIFNNYLYETILSKIDELMDNDYDWSEIGYEKPTIKNIDYAKSYISEFIITMCLQGYKIFIPQISNSENGGATLKWSKGDKILYFDILYKDNKYTKVWDDKDKTFVETKKLVKKMHAKIWEWLINNG